MPFARVIWGLAAVTVVIWGIVLVERIKLPQPPGDYHDDSYAAESVPSPPAVVSPTPAPAAPTVWYIANTNFDACIVAHESPQEQARNIRQNGEEPDVQPSQEHPGGTEVIVAAGIGLTETVWTYFPTKASCEASLP